MRDLRYISNDRFENIVFPQFGRFTEMIDKLNLSSVKYGVKVLKIFWYC